MEICFGDKGFCWWSSAPFQDVRGRAQGQQRNTVTVDAEDELICARLQGGFCQDVESSGVNLQKHINATSE